MSNGKDKAIEAQPHAAPDEGAAACPAISFLLREFPAFWHAHLLFGLEIEFLAGISVGGPMDSMLAPWTKHSTPHQGKSFQWIFRDAG